MAASGADRPDGTPDGTPDTKPLLGGFVLFLIVATLLGPVAESLLLATLTGREQAQRAIGAGVFLWPAGSGLPWLAVSRRRRPATRRAGAPRPTSPLERLLRVATLAGVLVAFTAVAATPSSRYAPPDLLPFHDGVLFGLTAVFVLGGIFGAAVSVRSEALRRDRRARRSPLWVERLLNAELRPLGAGDLGPDDAILRVWWPRPLGSLFDDWYAETLEVRAGRRRVELHGGAAVGLRLPAGRHGLRVVGRFTSSPLTVTLAPGEVGQVRAHRALIWRRYVTTPRGKVRRVVLRLGRPVKGPVVVGRKPAPSGKSKPLSGQDAAAR